MIIDDKLIDTVEENASQSPRLRMNFNLHESLDAKAQRLINVLLPGTVIPIHRHNHTAESYILVRGKMYVIFYNDAAEEIDRHLLDPHIGNYGVHIPIGQWHGIEIIEPSAIFEVKDGPYAPLQPEDML
ncbi:MAG: WbuC family cupin fold metalloprotein [Muribaculaceae bacterium]|nr:WbuC family cupin fold metalloprotein [Muribaculaceae bacterium]